MLGQTLCQQFGFNFLLPSFEQLMLQVAQWPRMKPPFPSGNVSQTQEIATVACSPDVDSEIFLA
jgi:hypothetical protein